MTSLAQASITTRLAWSVALIALVLSVRSLLERFAMAALLAQTFAADWGASRLGFAWSDPSAADRATTSAIARRAIRGVGVGLLATVAVVALLAAGGAITFGKGDEGTVSLLVIGFATAALQAARDEILQHGLLLRLLPREQGDVPKVLACGLTSSAAALGEHGSTARTVVVAGLFGVVTGALWLHDRPSRAASSTPTPKDGQRAREGAWEAWGARASWLFATTTLLRGGWVGTRIVPSAWGGDGASLGGGFAAIVGLATLAALAIAWAFRVDARHISPPRRGVS